jgi:enterochelin esterase-like enzyme
MFEPQSTVVFVLLVVLFGTLMWRTLASRNLALRLVGATVVFLPAMAFGVLAVNKYYDYYQTWSAAIADITNQSGAPPADAQIQLDKIDSTPKTLQLARQQGYTLRLSVAGQRSHITRTVYVFLPPQYFQPAYSSYRFPVIELMQGSPGRPQDWINVAGGTKSLVRLVNEGRAKPAVFVIPDANGGRNIDLQCLNQVGGPQDLTYLAQDVPDEIASLFRVEPPSTAWGIAGYSSGGYCAANMAIQFRSRYGFAGILSGYFVPSDNQWGNPVKNVNPFGNNFRLKILNNPLDQVQTLPKGTVIPQFWLGAGTANPGDFQDAQLLLQGLKILQPHVTLVLSPGAGHTMTTWRHEIPVMLQWMTQGVAQAAAKDNGTTQAMDVPNVSQEGARTPQSGATPRASASP